MSVAAQILPLATLANSWMPALIGAGVSAVGIGLTVFKLRPERDSLIAQAAEHAITAMSEVFEQLESELKASRSEVRRLLNRENELLRRIRWLEEEGRAELARLRQREQELLERIVDLEAELAARRQADT